MAEMIDELLEDARERMGKSVESIKGEMSTIRTGRASPHLLDRIVVDYYGAETPLNQLANVATTDARLLTLTPYDKSAINAIEKAIIDADIGMTPNNDGNVVRLQVPQGDGADASQRRRGRSGRRPQRAPRRDGRPALAQG
jgi:ribosome recycling factor